MVVWLLHVLGFSPEITDHLGEVRLAFHHPLALWMGIPLLLPSGYYIIRRQRLNLPSTSHALRVTLNLTRCAILALLVMILADPYLRLDHQRVEKPLVAVLLDYSRSMELPVGDFDSENEASRQARAAGYEFIGNTLPVDIKKALTRTSRNKHVQAVLQRQSESMFGALAYKYDFQFYSFGNDLKPLNLDAARLEMPEPAQPGMVATHLGDAVAQALNAHPGRLVAGIILISDGQSTGGRAPREAGKAAAAAATPIFAVPAGSSRRVQDVAIVDVFTSGLVSVGDTAQVVATVESQGLDERRVMVELREGNLLRDSKEVILQSAERQQVELSFPATEPGARYLTVAIPVQPEEIELLRSNNRDYAFVRVSEEKSRVLYIDGWPRWDFRFLKNAMRRDHGLAGRVTKEPDIMLEAELRRLPAEQHAAAVPQSLEDLAKYHTIILGDVSPQLLGSEWIKNLEDAVREKGVGLIVAAGPRHMPHSFGDTLLNLLPVRLQNNRAGVEPHVHQLFRLELTPEGAMHEAMRFVDDPNRNQQIWANMPPYYWSMAAERPAPGASVFAWNPTLQGNYGKWPVIASHWAGKGRVMVVGTDSTWLWRQNVGDRYFYKFWGQNIRFVARRDKSAANKSWLEIRPNRVHPGEDAQVELKAVDGNGSPCTDSSLSIQMVQENSPESAISLNADPLAPGRYAGKFSPSQVGEYRITYHVPNGAGVEAKLQVLENTEELRHPNVNRPALEQMAAASGGKLVELPDLATIADHLKGETKLFSFHREVSLWDNWMTLVVLVLIYSIDVGLRRLTGLS